MLKFIFAIFFYTLLAHQAFCQNYEVKSLGLEDGLSNNFVVGITQDRQGYLWYATESGLNRFDGKKFTVYKRRQDNKGISGNNLNKIFSDRKDDYVYVATQRDGLNRVNSLTGEVAHYKNDPSNPESIITNDITDITAARNGGLWISTFYRGVEYFDKQKQTFSHYNKKTYPGLGSDLVWTVREDHHSNLYIGHVDAGLSIISLTNRKVKNLRHSKDDPNSLPSDVVRAILIDNNDNVWIGTDNGLALYQKENERFVLFKHKVTNTNSLPSNSIYSLTLLNDGKLAIGTEKGGLSFLDINKQMFLDPAQVTLDNIGYSDDNTGLSNSTVREVYQDTFGNIWLGTYGGGINFIGHRGNYFRTWTYSPVQTKPIVLNNPVAWGITSDLHGKIWIGTDGGGINVFDSNRRVSILNSSAKGLKDDAIIAAMRDRDGLMWFGTFQGKIYVFDAKSNIRHEFTTPERKIDVRAFFQDDEGDILIGTTDGIYRYRHNQSDGKLEKVNSPQRSFVLVRAISQDDYGNYYIGLFGQGIVVLDQTFNVIANHNTSTGLPSNTIHHLFKDSNGQIWCSTSEGLVFFKDTKSFTMVADKQLNEPLDVRAAVEDENGNIWLSRTGGISKYVPYNKQIFHYDHHYGIPVGDFMSGSVLKAPNGKIYFGSQNGVCFFDPECVPTKFALSETKISSFKILPSSSSSVSSVVEIPIDSTIALTHDQNTLDINFNILDYSLSPMVAYSYMLKGLEDSWYPVEGNNIVFRNIPPGKYTLMIKSKIMNQEWSEHILTQHIVINPPFWWAWWSKILYIAIGIFILLTVFRFYKRKISLENTLLVEKLNHQHEQNLHEERIRFFTNITHELKTPLTLILGPLEDVRQDNELSQRLKDKLSIIQKSSTRLMGLVNQILEFQKIEDHNKELQVRYANIVKHVEDIGLKYKEYSVNRNVNFEIHCPEKEIYLFYDAEVVETMLDNLLSNAFKYTDKGYVTLRIRKINVETAEILEFAVSDTGRGIPFDEQERIFDRYYQVAKNNNVSGTGIGLALVSSLSKMHDATVFMNSSPGEGSTFYLRLKLNYNYPNAIHAGGPIDQVKIQAEETSDDLKPIVLIIEDDHDILDYIARVLTSNYRVFSANNGKSGLERAFHLIPDIIVSDVMMPEMDGFEMCGILKNDLRTSHIPIILLTAKDGVESRREGYTVGVDSYLVKPFSSSLLESRILNLLQSRKKLAKSIVEKPQENDLLESEVTLRAIDRVFLEKVEKIIKENILSDKIDVVFLADRLNMSHSTLYRKIKGLTELTINEFARKVKMEVASELLDSGTYTVPEVASMVGMNSLAYFKQCFKEQFGQSAVDYTKKGNRK
ncbi:two-component regulator propeller domain-containing protein [Sphingobacterium sp.]|uniref:two-component regulator propeller domain-containing protein n=1 Tax=Sphingobacterium sp. TaxID=341027 RepID=UPI00289F181D|nr:two-component regulator propeller domain-containing protein [Sphingobacterium sp.]